MGGGDFLSLSAPVDRWLLLRTGFRFRSVEVVWQAKKTDVQSLLVAPARLQLIGGPVGPNMSSLPSPTDNPLGALSGPNDRGGCDFCKKKGVKKRTQLLVKHFDFEIFLYVLKNKIAFN